MSERDLWVIPLLLFLFLSYAIHKGLDAKAESKLLDACGRIQDDKARAECIIAVK